MTLKRFALAAATIATLIPGQAKSQQCYGGAQLDAKTRYEFAGMPFSDGPVAQTTAFAGCADEDDALTVIGFASYDPDAGLNEKDLIGEYERALPGGVRATLDAAYLTIDGLGSTREVGAGVSVGDDLRFSDGLELSARHAYDFDLGRGHFTTATIAGKKTAGPIALGAALSASRLDEYYISDVGTSLDAKLSASTSAGPLGISASAGVVSDPRETVTDLQGNPESRVRPYASLSLSVQY